jgi:hypothetical protein
LQTILAEAETELESRPIPGQMDAYPETPVGYSTSSPGSISAIIAMKAQSAAGRDNDILWRDIQTARFLQINRQRPRAQRRRAVTILPFVNCPLDISFTVFVDGSPVRPVPDG